MLNLEQIAEMCDGDNPDRRTLTREMAMNLNKEKPLDDVKLLLQRKLTSREHVRALADAVGVPVAWVLEWAAGHRYPKPWHRQWIAEFYGVSIERYAMQEMAVRESGEKVGGRS